MLRGPALQKGQRSIFNGNKSAATKCCGEASPGEIYPARRSFCCLAAPVQECCARDGKKNPKQKQQHHAFCLLLIQLFITDVYSTFCCLWTLYRMSCDATRPIRNTCDSCQRKAIHIFIQNILPLTIPLMR